MDNTTFKTFYSSRRKIPTKDIFYQDCRNKKGLSPTTTHSHHPLLRQLLTGEREATSEDIRDTTTQEFLSLYHDMEENGYNDLHPIWVAIEATGRIVVVEGLHRIACATSLKIDPIPARVIYRDSQWMLFKQALLRQNNHQTFMYQRINHVDFQPWSYWRVDNEIRGDLVAWDLEHKLEGKPKTACVGLELACNSGTVSCNLARKGYRMIGLDTDPNAIDVAQKLSAMEDIGALNAQGENIATFSKCEGVVDLEEYEKFDFVVCFSLLNHHQVDGRSVQGKEIFRRLVAKSSLVYLDCPTQGDPVGGSSEFIQAETVFKWCESAGVEGSGRVVARHTDHENLMRNILVWER